MPNSRAKGARGEREAAKYLAALLDLPITRNARNGIETTDLHVPDLDIVIEVKYGYEKMDLHTALLTRACEQAEGYTKPDQHWCVLWKPPRKAWRLTSHSPFGQATIAGDDSIREFLMNYKR